MHRFKIHDFTNELGAEIHAITNFLRIVLHDLHLHLAEFDKRFQFYKFQSQ